MLSKCQFYERQLVDGVPVNAEYSHELYRTMNNVGLCGHLPHLLSSEIWPPNAELSFHQVHWSCQNLSWLLLCHKNWFCGKLRLNDFYLLLRSIASSWINIGVKRISQACFLHHLKNMEKNCKAQLWDEKQNRALFLDYRVSHETSVFILEEM